MDPDLLNLLRALGIGASLWLATAAVWVAWGLVGDARTRRRRAARLARRKGAVPTVPAFADPIDPRADPFGIDRLHYPHPCGYCGATHATRAGSIFCDTMRQSAETEATAS